MLRTASSDSPAEVDEIVDGNLVLEGESMIGDDIERTEDEESGEQVEVRRVKTSVAPKLPTLKEIELHNMGIWCTRVGALSVSQEGNQTHRTGVNGTKEQFLYW